MFPPEVVAYLAAVLVAVPAPGPDNLLAIGRGLSQGWAAAAASLVGAGLGIMCHTLAATLGLALVLQTSPLAFWVVRAAGAAYLLRIGFSARLSSWLARQPREVVAANVGAGLTFAAGLSILALERQKRRSDPVAELGPREMLP